MAFGSKFGSVSAPSKYASDGEWGLAFCAYERWAEFSLASVDVDAPSDFQGVPSGSIWGIGVCMNCVVRSRVSYFMENFAIYGARICHGVEGACLNKFAEAGVEVG